MASRRQVLAAVAAVAILSACGGGHHAAGTAPAHPTTTAGAAPAAGAATALLRRSRDVIDAAHAVHFTLASTGVAGTATAITSGQGDLVRPDQLRGTFRIAVSGFTANVGVIETGGVFYAEPPFQSHYSVTNPSSYGLGDPAQLLSAGKGVANLLTDMTDVRQAAAVRVDGERLDVVSGTVPGSRVPVLSDLDKAEPVRIVAMISPTSGQLRQVRLAGPFTAKNRTTTYTVTLTAYGESVTIAAPST